MPVIGELRHLLCGKLQHTVLYSRLQDKTVVESGCRQASIGTHSVMLEMNSRAKTIIVSPTTGIWELSHNSVMPQYRQTAPQNVKVE